jgi:hypothetical protein
MAQQKENGKAKGLHVGWYPGAMQLDSFDPSAITEPVAEDVMHGF